MASLRASLHTFARCLFQRHCNIRYKLILYMRHCIAFIAFITFSISISYSRLGKHLTTMSGNTNDEVLKAQTAKPTNDTIFGRILSGEIKTQFIYEDNQCVAFNDINPTAPKHFLVIPRKFVSQLSTTEDNDEQLLGHLLIVANKVAEQQGLQEGYRVVINNGRHGCQSVYHLHLHVIGGRQLGWPPG